LIPLTTADGRAIALCSAPEKRIVNLDSHIQEWGRLIVACGGLMSIGIGYRLFCARHALPARMISGALLAVLGVAMLIADARSITGTGVYAPRSRQRQPIMKDSFRPPKNQAPALPYAAGTGVVQNAQRFA
jgi:hypothetical protein